MLGAGGAAANGFTRALKMVGRYVTYGTNCDEYGLALAETDYVYDLPHACDPDYRSRLLTLCEHIEPDLVHAQNDEEVCQLSLFGTGYPCSCQAGGQSTSAKTSGIRTAVGRIIFRSRRRSFFTSPQNWNVCSGSTGECGCGTSGGRAGNGSIATDSYEFAKLWIERYQGWGQFTAAEVLSSETATWTGLYHEGDVRADQGRKRLQWGYSRNQPSGVSGITGVGETYTSADLTDTAMRAVALIDKAPHGLYGVDCVRNWYDNTWNPTEINIGRFHTTVSEFFATAGLNLPNLYCRLFFGEPVGSQKNLRDGIKWIRLMDRTPVML